MSSNAYSTTLPFAMVIRSRLTAVAFAATSAVALHISQTTITQQEFEDQAISCANDIGSSIDQHHWKCLVRGLLPAGSEADDAIDNRYQTLASNHDLMNAVRDFSCGYDDPGSQPIDYTEWTYSPEQEPCRDSSADPTGTAIPTHATRCPPAHRHGSGTAALASACARTRPWQFG